MLFLLFGSKLESGTWGRSLKRGALIAALGVAFVSGAAQAEPRRILVCTGTGTSPEVKNGAQDLMAQAGRIPLFEALTAAGDAEGVAPQASEGLLSAKAYPMAAHNHLVVIGLRSKDALLEKIWGFTTTIDEEKRQVYAQGWGYMEGDIGWIECDRNPFLHSEKIKSVPEDTIIVKISGTSERGVLAALQAFEKGQLSGFVVAGAMRRPKTTILDLDPAADPVPVSLPAKIDARDGAAFFAGWMQVPAANYRAVLDMSGLEPKRVWRAKYLSAHMMEEAPAVRWLGGVNRRAFGNAVDIVEFQSAADARQAAAKIAPAPAFHEVEAAGHEKTWEAPEATDEVMTQPHWNVLVTSSGRFLLMSTLPAGATTAIGDLLTRASAVAR